ncbi:MAG: CHAT domain-containing protein, partial [Xanthomonadales bacterium]|nr:CHAT domain-containing protein [Xanthomonadales bacterium]
LRAQLAVLNACQLGAGSETGNRGSLSFASALANAGVDQVVAATWPVSDAAAGTWVPAFYSHLDPERPDTSA